MLDEFPQLGKLESIEKSLAICAGYGVKICIVAQSMGQLNKIYTKDNAIPGNCHVQIYFTPTLEDGGGTAKTLSDTLGEKTIHSYSKSNNGKPFEGSTSTSNMARKLMTPDEVRRMPADRELVFVAGFRPIYGKKIRYYEEQYFMDRIMDPPLFSDTATQIQSFSQLFAYMQRNVKRSRSGSKPLPKHGSVPSDCPKEHPFPMKSKPRKEAMIMANFKQVKFSSLKDKMKRSLVKPPGTLSQKVEELLKQRSPNVRKR